jgi:hypothetical protein
MNTVYKARVRGGRLILDEPTDLPEGYELPLKPADLGDDMDAEERAALHQELAAALAEDDAGETDSAEEVLAELRQKRAPR